VLSGRFPNIKFNILGKILYFDVTLDNGLFNTGNHI